MAIALDAVSSGNSTSNTLNFSHTCSGTDRVLVVGLACANGSVSVSGVTYNGVAMTQVFTQNPGYLIAFFVLAAPATGSNTISITLSGANANLFTAVSASYTGADQASPIDTFAQNISNSVTLSFTTGFANSQLVDINMVNNGALPITPVAGQTQIAQINSSWTSAGSRKNTTTAGAYTMDWTGISGFKTAGGVAVKEKQAGSIPNKIVQPNYSVKRASFY